MKIRLFPFLLAVLFLMLSGCVTVPESTPESTPPSGGEVSQTIPSSESADDTNHDDEFQTFIETWKLSGLIPESITMTAENQDRFIKYFQDFDDVTQNYIILLLQNISIGEVTPTDDYNDYEYGVYLNYCEYCLYDMNRDGFPELILRTGNCEADYMFTVYTVSDGALVDCGELVGGHSSLLINGSGDVLRYEGHMGVYNITVSTLDGTMFITKEIADGELDYSKNEEYPELEEFGYGDYNQWLEFVGIPTLFLAPAG